MTFFLSVQQIEEIHASQIASYGGRAGLRDRGALEAAVARPAMTFGGEDLYPDIPAKAAALMHSLVMNHPYVDGNKRLGAHAGIVFLEINGLLATFTPKELEQVTMATARGELDAERLAIWLRQRSTRED
ncbi:MAG: type II toxin-antitoxin system death-on-curing family toxin [Thermoanaerobaculia bacterium]